MDSQEWRTGYDPFRLLLCSVGSASAGPILAKYLDRDFLQPLAAVLPGDLARACATVIASQILGFVRVRVTFSSPDLDPAEGKAIHDLLLELLRISADPS